MDAYPIHGFGERGSTARRNSRNFSVSGEEAKPLSNGLPQTDGTHGKRTNLPGGVFSGSGKGDAGVEDTTPLSLYNKKKWLPICRDLPARISHRCCFVMKKSPLEIYKRQNDVKPFIGTLAEESRLRKQAWIRTGCNAFDSKKPTSQPLSFWTEQDILGYIFLTGIDYADVYGDIVYEQDVFHTTNVERTGCIFCLFGMHLEKNPNRFQKLKQTHPKQYDFCIGGGQWIDNPDFDPNYNGEPDEFGWVDWNPQKLWVPSKQGLGYSNLLDMANEIMENNGYKAMWNY